MTLFDAHTHIHFPAYDFDREEVIKRAQVASVKMITVGTNLQTSKEAIVVAEKYPKDIWATVGIHPTEIGNWSTTWRMEIENLKMLAQYSMVVAIGECGLDYYRLPIQDSICQPADKIQEKQKEVFLQQVKIAKEFKKPLMIHCRPSKGTNDAYEDLLLISQFHNSPIPKIIHFFVGSLKVAKKLLDISCYFTFGGAITFVRDYDEVIKYLPLENILLETDAPYVAPVPYRGQRNEPAYVMEVAKKIAEIKNLSLEKVIEQTMLNTKKVLNL